MMATLAFQELSADIIAGNLRKSVSEEIYNTSLAEALAAVMDKSDFKSVEFDPNIHLQSYAGGPVAQKHFLDTRRITMKELGLSNDLQISPIGVSDPFPLFTDEAIDVMRKEILQKDLFLKYARVSFNSTSGMDCNMRGYAKDDGNVRTPFTYAAWSHPKTVELVSTMAGVDLEIIMDYEVAQVNIGITDDKTVVAQRRQHEIEERERCFSGEHPVDNIPAIVGWHYDSYPFVCVLMLSDTSEMIGGETCLRMGDSRVARVSGPQRGSASVLQGRLIEHLAPKPIGATERITMVTSYRAKNPMLHDGSVLGTVKPEINFGSRYHEFYRQWVTYRSELIKARLDVLINSVCDTFDKSNVIDTLKDIEDYLVKTYKEMEITSEDWKRIVNKG